MTANANTLKTQILIELAQRPSASSKMLAMALAKPQAKISKALRELEGDRAVVCMRPPGSLSHGFFYRLPTPPTVDTRPAAPRAARELVDAAPTLSMRALEVLRVMGQATSTEVATLTGTTQRQAYASLTWLVTTNRAVVDKTKPKAHLYRPA